MDALIRAAGLDGPRHALRRAEAAAPVPAAPVAAPAHDWRAECDRLRAQLEAQRREFDEALAQCDGRLVEERTALEQEIGERAAAALREAAERGHAEGLERGIADGRAEGRAALRAPAERLAAAAATLAASRTALLDEAEDAMVELVFEAVCRMLASDAALHAAVAAAVADSRRRVDRSLVLTVAVHPDDLEALGAFDAEGDKQQGVRFVAADDPGIGGCVIESARGTLDVRLDTQLDALRQALLDVRAARRAQGRVGA